MPGLLVDIAGVTILHDWDMPVCELQKFARNTKRKDAPAAEIRLELIDSGIIKGLDDGLPVFFFYKEITNFFNIDPSEMSYADFRRVWSLAQRTRNEPLLSLLSEIRKHRHSKMAIASNINELHWENLVKNHYPELVKLFDTFVLSHTLGVSKPDPRFYLECSRRLGIDPSALVLVDDKEENGESFILMGGIFVHYTEARHNEAETELRNIFNLPMKLDGNI